MSEEKSAEVAATESDASADYARAEHEAPKTKTVDAWAVAKKLSVPTDHARRAGDFYTHSPAKLEGAIGLRVAQKKWPARRQEQVTEADFDAAISEFETIRLG